MEDLQHLSIVVSHGPDRARIFLRGELDWNSANVLHARFDETFAGNGSHQRSVIMLDLSEIRFCDAAGLRALWDLADKCHRLGTTLRLVNPSPKVRRVMELTDTLDQFNIEEDLGTPNRHAESSPRSEDRGGRRA